MALTASQIPEEESPRRTKAQAKGAADESFPVASLFLPAATRGPILHFYRFARTADDIADSPDLRPAVKLAALEAAESALRGIVPRQREAIHEAAVVRHATALRAVLDRTGVPVGHACHLLQAFKKDAVQSRYESWSDLLLYCGFSAAPVGRFLLDLHGEARTTWVPADALCNAHQVLNHVQDCRADYLRLDRVYIPDRWLRHEGLGPEVLGAAVTDPRLRRVLDRVLSGVEQLLGSARLLPPLIRHRGLRIQAAATVAMADQLLRKLRCNDPLARRVVLTKSGKARAVASGLLRGWIRPAKHA